MSQLTIAITGMNAKPDNPGPGLAVARCLCESEEFNGKIIGLGYDVLDPGLYLNHICDKAYLLPYPSAGEEALLNRIKKIHREEAIDILIPCLDAELIGFARLLPELNALGIQCLIPNTEQIQLRDKDRLGEVADVANINYPQTKSITHTGFFYQCIQEGWQYPLVVKGKFYDAGIAHNADQAAAMFRRIAAEWGLPVLVQQYVEGEEINLTGFGDGEGGLHSVVMMRKRATTDKGKAWAGISIWDDKLYEFSEKMVKAINWTGPLEVEVLQDKNGRYYLIEINPRFPAWIYLSHGIDRNVPIALIQHIQGMPKKELQPPATGHLYIRYAQETVMSLQQFESMTMYGEIKS
jgi:carbamoyl-phosphate synthase large subunit